MRCIRTVLLVLAFALPWISTSAEAQTNLLHNAGFDAGLGPWNVQGAAAWVPTGGLTSPGAVSCTDADNCQILQCVDVTPLVHPQTFTSEIALMHSGNTATITRFALAFVTRDCSGIGQTVDFSETFFPANGWTTYSSSFDSVAGTGSLRVIYSISAASGGPPMDARLDDASLEATVGPLFLDGFESGDTSEWSSTSP